MNCSIVFDHQFLDLRNHPTGIKLDHEIVLDKMAVILGKLHRVYISGPIR